MLVKLQKSAFFGQLSAPTSKSFAIRAIICALLADKPTHFAFFDTCDDIDAALRCAQALGASFLDNTLYPPEHFNKTAILDCGESAAVLRFFICVAATLDGEYVFTGSKRLLARPLGDLLRTLEDAGAHVTAKSDAIIVKGKITAKNISVSADISSQFVSGLLLALPLLKSKVCLRVVTDIVSAPYIDMTLQVMNVFGVAPEQCNGTYGFSGNNYFTPGQIVFEGDWSAAAFMLACGALAGTVTVDNLSLESMQADKYIIDVLKAMNADFSYGESALTVSRCSLAAIDMDFTHCPDLVPVVAVLCSTANGVSVLRNIERLKYKESNRIDALISMLHALGILSYEKGGCLFIESGAIKGGEVSSFSDHRMAMSAAVAAVAAEGDIFLSDAASVTKSYRNFWRDYVKCGGRYVVLEG